MTGRSSWRLIAILGVVILTGAACRGNNDNVVSAGQGSPTASFANPPHVTGTTIKISLASSGITIRPANGDGSGHTGHYVVFDNQDPPVPGTAIPTDRDAEGIVHTADSSLTLRGEDLGPHRLTVTLADGTNARVGDGAQTATIEVKPPGLSLSVDQSTPACPGAQVTVSPNGFNLPVVAPGMATLSAKGEVTVPSTTTTTTTPTPGVTAFASPAVTTTTTAAAPAAGSPSTTAGPTTTAPPPAPAQISYFLDRPPASGPATPADFGSLTAASLTLCVTDLTPGRHTVWAVTVDSTGAPLTTPIESKVSFTVS